MVREQLAKRNITDSRLLAAMGKVPRENFLPPSQRHLAYKDCALPLSHHQTVSQPYVVAATLQALRLTPDSRVLEVGAGSGYAAAVAAEIAQEVVTLERIKTLAERARCLLGEMGYGNTTVIWADGHGGHSERAPYNAVFVSAAAREVPEVLFRQLADGGRLVAPVGERTGRQELVVYSKPMRGETAGNLPERAPEGSARMGKNLFTVSFVPMLPGLECPESSAMSPN